MTPNDDFRERERKSSVREGTEAGRIEEVEMEEDDRKKSSKRVTKVKVTEPDEGHMFKEEDYEDDHGKEETGKTDNTPYRNYKLSVRVCI